MNSSSYSPQRSQYAAKRLAESARRHCLTHSWKDKNAWRPKDPAEMRQRIFSRQQAPPVKQERTLARYDNVCEKCWTDRNADRQNSQRKLQQKFPRCAESYGNGDWVGSVVPQYVLFQMIIGHLVRGCFEMPDGLKWGLTAFSKRKRRYFLKLWRTASKRD